MGPHNSKTRLQTQQECCPMGLRYQTGERLYGTKQILTPRYEISSNTIYNDTLLTM